MKFPKLEEKITWGTILSILVVFGSLLFASFSFYTSSINTSNAVPVIREEIKSVIEVHNRDIEYLVNHIEKGRIRNDNKYLSKEVYKGLDKKVDEMMERQAETNRLLIKIINDR